jgi:hypothetical protein
VYICNFTSWMWTKVAVCRKATSCCTVDRNIEFARNVFIYQANNMTYHRANWLYSSDLYSEFDNFIGYVAVFCAALL